ncbi:PREDICTED: ubiquitin conjugation factor E4 A [Nicrophorus vespilloides]|uniref:Ubiquitin conjugation factor E4 A n=1 Tax=Nicrophorus vespilloides TaxID=110193 RepID=A0ABM1M150_NICVS|nr:PREDICTED: ubiquitin conjugation factor E4 A [Nicrophorus vespilloides]
MSNPFAGLLGHDMPSTSFSSRSTAELQECQVLERIFGFTLSKTRSQEQQLVFMDEQALIILDDILNIDELNVILFERLFIQNAGNSSPWLKGDKIASDKGYYEDRVIKYLYHCYVNNIEEEEFKHKDKTKIKIVDNVATAFHQPDLFFGQEVYEQMIELLKENVPYIEMFFNDIINRIHEEGDSLKEPIVALLKIIHASVSKMNLMSLDYATLDIIKVFTKTDEVANVFLDYNTPANATSGIDYSHTLLGSLLNLSILPKHPSGPYDFFQTPLDPASITATENILFTNMDKITQHIQTLILNLLKCRKTARLRILGWIGSCLKANADRGKLWNTQIHEIMTPATVGDGFMLNLGNVLMRLCQPFCQGDNFKKILKVDPTYCAVPEADYENKNVHLPGMYNETCLLPMEESNENELRVTALHYTFVTECFYMGHKALELGHKIVVDKLVKLNQEIGRIERAYNNAMAEERVLGEVIDTIKNKMSTEMARYLTIKASCSEPVMLEMIFNFTSATAYWLSQVAFYDGGFDISYAPQIYRVISFPLDSDVPDTLKCIPESILENIVGYLVFLRRFFPNVFEERGFEQMQPILTFIVIFMGSTNYMKNPHLRARLAEGLEALLPFHKEHPPGYNSLGGFQREMLFKTHEHRLQIVESLLEVFVGIEMTGQSVQFEQKFNYRRPMYAIIDYIWNLEEHRQIFQYLARRAEHSMDDVTPPLFLRFINLLMNDAVFLLDEALSNMSKLREMEMAKENGEWDELSTTERAQNLGYMNHIGMMAKFDNILGRDTIRTLVNLTSEIQIVFTHGTMVDRVAAMLNYFLLNLVGPNQKNFKVKDNQEYSFEPATTVVDICSIYVNLKENEAFCLAVSQDGRSYSPQLFGLAQNVLAKIGKGGLVGEMVEVASRVTKLAEAHQASEEVISEAPDHFLDPIMSTLMYDPVILPSSKQTVDRTTIARHLLSDQTDPFNRSPLTMDQVVPNKELKAEIDQWLIERHICPKV